ncbi:MAG: ABC transporter substrate-binding protein [Streptosporangiaceae bacterium]|nr:ABC transporter substrate-binding protein [Streptosporangiaceae bacterium]MBV9857023.1 ABC transporter substrate-binding protein [Streptosporangiaceae bacterium]
MKHQTRLAAVAAAVAIATAGVAGCSSGSSSSSGTGGSGPEQTHITVAEVPATDEVPFYLALKNGYFRQQGLTVTPVPVHTSVDAIPELVRGSVQIIIGGNDVSFFNVEAKGVLNVRLIAPAGSCTQNSFALLTLPHSTIRKPSDLAGKKISVPTKASINTLLINSQLQDSGVNPSSVHYVDIPFVDASAALQAHQIDAISMIEPFLTEAETSGAEELMPLCKGPTANIPLSGDFTTASWAQKNPRTVAAFQRAMAQGAAAADSNHAADEQVLQANVKVPPSMVSLVNFNSYPTSLNVAQIQRLADLMFDGGMLKARLNVTSIMVPTAGAAG